MKGLVATLSARSQTLEAEIGRFKTEDSAPERVAQERAPRA
jgi:hypothetical protein